MKSLLATFAIAALASQSLFAAADSANDVKPLLIGATPNDFEVHTQSGQKQSFSDALDGKPAVVIFYRGGWCPYCNRHLQEVSRIEDELVDLGYKIIGVSPDTPDKLEAMDEKIQVNYSLYSDSDFQGADAFGISYKLSDKQTKRYANNGIALKMHGDHGLLPVPSVFILNPKGEVTFSYVDPNIRFRIPSELLLAAAKSGLKFHE